MSILPVFSSMYSIGDSILTIDEAGKTEEGNPVSICDIVKNHGIKQCLIVDKKIDGFLEAYKNIEKAGLAQLIYGVKFKVVPDMTDKTQESIRQESNIIIFIRNSQGYSDLLKIWNKAAVAGSFSPQRESAYGRIDWVNLAALWTENLSLALPFFSSFLAKNVTTFSSLIPSLPVPANQVTLFREIDSGLPFAPLIDEAVDRFAADTGAQIQPVKSIYYMDPSAFDGYTVYRAILNRGEFSRPEVQHLASDRFCFTEWQRLTKEAVC